MHSLKDSLRIIHSSVVTSILMSSTSLTHVTMLTPLSLRKRRNCRVLRADLVVLVKQPCCPAPTLASSCARNEANASGSLCGHGCSSGPHGRGNNIFGYTSPGDFLTLHGLHCRSGYRFCFFPVSKRVISLNVNFDIFLHVLSTLAVLRSKKTSHYIVF